MLMEKSQKSSKTVNTSVDQIVKLLLSASTQEEISQILNHIFLKLDADRSGALSYHEMREGLKKMRFQPPIMLTEQEFLDMTEQKTLCNDEEEIDAMCFEQIMRKQVGHGGDHLQSQ